MMEAKLYPQKLWMVIFLRGQKIILKTSKLQYVQKVQGLNFFGEYIDAISVRSHKNFIHQTTKVCFISEIFMSYKV